jgi:DNA-binding NtrC family response regulator
MSVARILVVDNEEGVQLMLGRLLRGHGYEVETVGSVRAAEAELRRRPPDLAIVDHGLPDGTGLELLPVVRAIDARVPIVMLTGFASIELAVDAVKGGAEHFLSKPVEPSALLLIVQRSLENYRNRRRQIARTAHDVRRERDPFAGVSDVIKRLADHAHRVLDSDRPVLIEGETGTGKGVLAAWLHQHGPRAEESFVDINCAGLSGELMESELFGHERGAFTGAATSKLGLLEVADRGTVFLDEIGEIGLGLQPRLLKVLEDRRFRRVGDVRDRTVDVRLIAATNRDLAQQSSRGAFRSDLYFRINTLRLRMPPLRERREDIPVLARAVAADTGAGHPVEVTPEALRALQAHDWPGNVRELRNVIERALLLSGGATRLELDELRFDGRDPDGSALVQLRDGEVPDHLLTLDEMEQRHIERAVKLEGGSVERAAARLGVSRSTLYQKLKRYREKRGSSPPLP